MLAALLSFYSNTYSSVKINVDSLLAEAKNEEFIVPDPSDCSFGFDMLDNGFPYEGKIFEDIAEELDLSKVKSCLLKDTKYRTVVKVLIDSTGNLAESNILISSGIKQIDVEALRVINSLNKWTIPIQNGKPISVSISIPVLFKLEE
ncbi:MAG: energy transducer TonB [Chlorobiota bacterium]